MAMIKKIHYCWFGGEKPELVKRNVEHWTKLNPDFEICEWNESNIDVSTYEFGRRAAADGKWGFLADIVRLEKLIEHGGVYMDADVELIRPFESIICKKDENRLIMGYMYDCALGTAVLYAPPGHTYLKEILASYRYIKPDIYPVNNTIFTAYFINHAENFLLNGKEWENELCHVYPKEMFELPSFIKSRGMSIHHGCGSWRKAFNDSFVFKSNRVGLDHVIQWAGRKRDVWKALKCNEFEPCYRAAVRGRRMPFDVSPYYEQADPYQDIKSV